VTRGLPANKLDDAVIGATSASGWANPGLKREHFRQIAPNGFGDGHNAYAHSMAMFKGRLYVGTTRSNLCLIRNSVHLNIDVWPIECPYRPYEDEFERDSARAEIWCHDFESAAWERVYQAPMVLGNHGRMMSRDLGYRGMTVYQGASDPEPLLYLTNWSRSHADGPEILYSQDGDAFECAPRPDIGEMDITSLRSLVRFRDMLCTAPSGARRKRQDEKGNPNISGLPIIFATADPRSGNWVPLNASGFGDPENLSIFELAVLDDHLYAGTFNRHGFQLWRTSGEGRHPFRWERVLTQGAYRGPLNQLAVSMQVFEGALYIGTGIQNGGYDHTHEIGPAGAELLRVYPDGKWDLLVGSARPTPDGNKSPLSSLGPGFGNFFNGYFWRMGVHENWLYVGTMEWSTTLRFLLPERRNVPLQTLFSRIPMNHISEQQGGFELWRSRDGENWIPVDKHGLGNPFNYGVRNLVSTPGGLCIGTANPFGSHVAERRPGNQWEYVANPRGGLEIWLGGRNYAGSSG
jgi:hypothetical protein